MAAVASDAQLAGLPRVESVPDLISDTTTEQLAQIEVAPSGQAPQPTTPAQYANVVSAYVYADQVWPGIGKVAGDLHVGKTRAGRIVMEARDLLSEFDRAGVVVVRKH